MIVHELHDSFINQNKKKTDFHSYNYTFAKLASDMR